jgi:hypothetical protein
MHTLKRDQKKSEALGWEVYCTIEEVIISQNRLNGVDSCRIMVITGGPRVVGIVGVESWAIDEPVSSLVVDYRPATNFAPHTGGGRYVGSAFPKADIAFD